MADLFINFIDAIEKRKQQLDDVLNAYRAFIEKLDALPHDLAEEARHFLGVGSGPSRQSSSNGEVVRKLSSDLAGVPALQCTRAILTDNHNQPMHYSEIAKTAIARGYRGRLSGTPEEEEARTIQSFWAAMSRSEDFETVGRGKYRIVQRQQNPQ